MNVYDEAHSLAQAIKDSEEFKQYDTVKKRVNSNPEISKIIADFQEKSMEMQAKQMMGQEITEDMNQAIQSLYVILAQDPLAAEYLQCEMRFSIMMQDVYKILGEAVGASEPVK